VKLHLSEPEIETLTQLSINHRWADVRQRAFGLLLIGQGLHSSQVSQRLGVGQTSQYNWYRAWTQQGITGLLGGHGGGRPAKLTDKWIRTCVELATEQALSAGELAHRASEIHGQPFPCSLGILRQMLKTQGLSYKRCRMSLKKKRSPEL
jgi:transposase